MTQFSQGDWVTYNPTGEEWKVAQLIGCNIVLGTRPRWLASASDCTLICGCTTSDERADCNRPCDTVVE